MKAGVIVSSVLALGAGIGLTAVFVSNASPYVTVADAQPGTKVHVVGKIVPDTLKQNPMQREVIFELKDETGTMRVRYVGPAQSNLSHANQVVVIGAKKNDTFEAHQMLVKCPSKYESESATKA